MPATYPPVLHAAGAAARSLMGLALLLTLGLLVAMPLAALDLYQAEAETEGRGERALQAAFATALGDVLVRVTGRRESRDDPVLRSALGNPAALVQQYRLLADGRVSVSFDPVALRAGLDAADYPVWAEPRPVVLLWLVAEQPDRQPEFHGLAERRGLGPLAPEEGLDEPVVEHPLAELPALLEEVGRARGLSVLQPILDFQELMLVRADALWEGDFTSLENTAGRYGADSVLVARLGWQEAAAETGARLAWTLLVGDEMLEWEAGIKDGLHELADRLAGRLAATRSGQQELRLLVSGVQSFSQWGRLNAYLGSLGIVDAHQVEQVSGELLLLRLTIRGDRERLERTLALGRVIEPMAGDLSQEARGWRYDLRYRLQGGQR